MKTYQSLSNAIGTLRGRTRFFNPAAYEQALQVLEAYVLSIAQREQLPYTMYPESQPSVLAGDWDYPRTVAAIQGTLMERFLQDYLGFTLRLETYDVIAFSAGNAFQLATSLFIARLLKQAGIRARVFIGGHAVFLAGTTLLDDQELGSVFDAAIPKGGADIFVKACEDLIAGKLRRVYEPGDVTADRDAKGFPVDRPYQLALRPDAQGFYLSPHQVFSIYSAIGCSYGACTFCSSNRKASPYAARQVEVMADEIQLLQKSYGISHFNICDNNFDPQRADEFCRELERRQLRIYWQCTTRVYAELDRSLMQRMRRCGCVIIHVGLESANNRILRQMRKGYSVKEALGLLVEAEAAKMRVHLYCICSFPSETEAESRCTLDFLLQNAGRYHSVYFQDYEAQLAMKIFANALGNKTQGFPASRMIHCLLQNPVIAKQFVAHGNLIRRRGYPMIEDHNFLFLAHSMS